MTGAVSPGLSAALDDEPAEADIVFERELSDVVDGGGTVIPGEIALVYLEDVVRTVDAVDRLAGSY